MAKEKSAKKSTKAGARSPSLAALRTKIDRVDQDLVRLMNERARIVLEIGKLKNNTGISAYVPAREDEVLSRVLGASTGPLADRSVRAVFRELISGSRAAGKGSASRIPGSGL